MFTRSRIRSFIPLLQKVRNITRHTESIGESTGLFSAVSNQMYEHDQTTVSRDIVSHKVEVNGVHLHYETCGTGKNMLLLLPGALGSSKTDFLRQLQHINRDMFTMVAWDPRGYGKSRPPDRDWPLHFLERDAQDAAQLMENIGMEKYSLLGWSDGGITACMVAARKPHNIKKLIVWGASSYVTDDDQALVETVRDIDKWSERMRTPFIEMYGEDYFRKQWSAWTDAFLRYKTDRQGDICKEELANITCPTLIIHGEKDAMCPGFHAEYIHKSIKNSRLHVMPEGKHNLHIKYYKEFNSMVENFIIEN